MIILTLLKGVPAKTAQVVSVGGVLKREEMNIVMNPHDAKAVEAADYVKRRVGGKVVGISMGPESKMIPIMNDLYGMEVEGVDETVLLSDRRMAGADTLATAYTISLGIKKVLDANLNALDELLHTLDSAKGAGEFRATALRLYDMNLLQNRVISRIPSVKSSIVGDYVTGRASKQETRTKLEDLRRSLEKFIVLAGIKTTDGETGSVGPQVAEALSDIYGRYVPHVTYVHDFEMYPEKGIVVAERKISRTVQRLEFPLPALLTIATEYRSRVAPAGNKKETRANNYRGKIREVAMWDASAIEADLGRVGLEGSPTLVGPGLDIGKPLTQKFLNSTPVFKQRVEAFTSNGQTYGPFDAGDSASGLPKDVLKVLADKGCLETFTYDHLVRELFGELDARA